MRQRQTQWIVRLTERNDNMETNHSMMVRHGLLLLLFTLEKILKREVSDMGIFLQVGVVTGQKVGR